MHLIKITGYIDKAERAETKNGKPYHNIKVVETEKWSDGSDHKTSWGFERFWRDGEPEPELPRMGAWVEVEARLKSHEWGDRIFLKLVVRSIKATGQTTTAEAEADNGKTKDEYDDMPF